MVESADQSDEGCKKVRFHASTFAIDFPEVQGAIRFSASNSSKSNIPKPKKDPSTSSQTTKSRVSKSRSSSFLQDSMPDLAAALTSVTEFVGLKESDPQAKRTKTRRRSSSIKVYDSAVECKENHIDGKNANDWLLPGHKIELRHVGRESAKAYRIDNQQLIACTRGLAYRNSKNLQDKAGNDKFAPWGEIVLGHDEGDGWLRVGEYYLPMQLKSSRVIVPETVAQSASMTSSTNPRDVKISPGSLQRPNANGTKGGANVDSVAGGSSEVAHSSSSLEPKDVQAWLWPRKVRVFKKNLKQESSHQPILENEPRWDSRKEVIEPNDDIDPELPHSLHSARLHDNGAIAHAASTVNPDALSLSNSQSSHTSNAPPSPQTQIQPVQPQPQPHALVPGVHIAPLPTYRMVMVELELDADNPYRMKVHEVEHIPRHAGYRQTMLHGSHNGPVLSIHESPGHPVFHAYLLVKEPVVTPAPIATPTDTSSSMPPQYPASSSHDFASSGQLAAPPNLAPQTQQPTHGADQAAVTTAAMSSSALAQFVEQGIIFGSISSVAMEMTQLAVAQRSTDQQLGLLHHGPQIAVAAARGASIGALGAGLAFMFGPVAPTAILVGYGVSRECIDQAINWNCNLISGNDAAGRSLEVLLGATSGVTAAWAAAMLLTGLSGAAVAAAAGCCGFAGNLGGRHLGKLLADALAPMSDAERRLLLAYVELGVSPECTNKELERAFRKAALACHPDKAKNGSTKSHAKFARLSAAMDKIRAARGMISRPHRNSMSTPLSLQAR